MKDYRERITDEAAEWFAKLQDSDTSVADRAAFADWLSASTEHVREYLSLTALRTDLSELPSGHGVESLIRLAAQSRDENVIPGAFAATSIQQRTFQERHNRSAWWAAAACATLLAVAIAWWLRDDVNSATYSTSIGEQKSFPLPDGSLVTLNAVSRLKLRFSEAHRDIQLLSGEALFNVAKNPSRPFRVATDDSLIQVVGTQFNVYHRSAGTTVTVVEGAVKVQKSMGAAPAVQLTKDQRARVTSREPRIAISAVDASADTAWRERRLVFESRPLKEVVAEFNLYNETPLTIRDARLDGIRVSGAFNANDPRSFALFLDAAKLAQVRIDSQTVSLWPAEKSSGR